MGVPPAPKIDPAKMPANSRVEPPDNKKRELVNKDAPFAQKKNLVFTPFNSLLLKRRREKAKAGIPKIHTSAISLLVRIV
jgi:hypothetical protein